MIPGARDPDIGRCDVCGGEDGRRFRTVWQGVHAWLCRSCIKQERTAS